MGNKLKTVDAETLLSTPMSKTMFIVDGLILISIRNVFYPLALSNAHDGITRKVVDCLAETVYHLFQCSKYLIAKSSGS